MARPLQGRREARSTARPRQRIETSTSRPKLSNSPAFAAVHVARNDGIAQLVQADLDASGMTATEAGQPMHLDHIDWIRLKFALSTSTHCESPCATIR